MPRLPKIRLPRIDFSSPRVRLALIVALAILSLFLDLPLFKLGDIPKLGPKLPERLREFELGRELNLRKYGINFYRDMKIKKGLDLAGGVQLILEADVSQVPQADKKTALEAARNVMERRVNFLGVTEPTVQTSIVGDSHRIIIEMPGVQDPDQAVATIGQTAKLDFREYLEEPVEKFEFPSLANTKETGVTGADLKKAQASFDPNTGEPVVNFELTDDGSKKFEEVTARLTGKRLAIFLDDQPITIVPPVVRETISQSGVISGSFSIEEAKTLALQLSAGALPAPVTVIEQRQVGATLGQESIQKSITAGVLGLFLVGFFMVGNYGRLGILAVWALLTYGIITLAIFKLIPVVLTLSGVAGFLLSMGMAVDANILIFERIKEELRWGRERSSALEVGFGRAWDSIRDANVATIFTALILFNPYNWGFLVTSGMVRGFALTLLIGVLVSLFTGVVVTRTLVRNFYK